MGVGAVPEEGEKGRQYTSDIDKDGIHTCKEDWVGSGEGSRLARE